MNLVDAAAEQLRLGINVLHASDEVVRVVVEGDVVEPMASSSMRLCSAEIQSSRPTTTPHFSA